MGEKLPINQLKDLIRSISPGLMKSLSKIKHRVLLKTKKPEIIFSEYFVVNKWGDKESRSGPGSRLDRTEKIREALPELAIQYHISTVLDIPCGDFNWMQLVDWNVDYTGADIVPELINQNQNLYGKTDRRFLTLDILKDPLPKVDLVICRDCLVHFSYQDIFRAIKNLKASGATYLLTTTMVARSKNSNIITGEFRVINFQKSPFSFPEPLKLIDDTYPLPSYYDKYLGFWKIKDLPNL